MSTRAQHVVNMQTRLLHSMPSRSSVTKQTHSQINNNTFPSRSLRRIDCESLISAAAALSAACHSSCDAGVELSSDWQSGESRRLLTGLQTKGSVSLLAWHAGGLHVAKKSWRWSTRANLEALPVLGDFNLIHERLSKRWKNIHLRSLSLIHTNKLCITEIRALAHWEDTFYTGLHKLTAHFIWQIQRGTDTDFRSVNKQQSSNSCPKTEGRKVQCAGDSEVWRL